MTDRQRDSNGDLQKEDGRLVWGSAWQCCCFTWSHVPIIVYRKGISLNDIQLSRRRTVTNQVLIDECYWQ